MVTQYDVELFQRIELRTHTTSCNPPLACIVLSQEVWAHEIDVFMPSIPLCVLPVSAVIGKKLDSYPMDERSVMLLLERVNEASRIAAMELRDEDSQRKYRRKHGLSDGDGADADEETQLGQKKIHAALQSGGKKLPHAIMQSGGKHGKRR